MTLKELNEMWVDVLAIYRDCRNNGKTPDHTAIMLIEKYGLEKIKELCHAYCLGLPTDGRLYPVTRTYVNSVPVEVSADDAYLMGNLVEIHPSHMNQIILAVKNIERLRHFT